MKEPPAPVLTSTEVILGSRPNSVGVENVEVLEVSSEQLRDMTDNHLRDLCLQVGIAPRPDWKRGRLLTALMRAAVDVVNC